MKKEPPKAEPNVWITVKSETILQVKWVPEGGRTHGTMYVRYRQLTNREPTYGNIPWETFVRLVTSTAGYEEQMATENRLRDAKRKPK